jgi:uncharacterized repeat protein (TIGR02543 family)
VGERRGGLAGYDPNWVNDTGLDWAFASYWDVEAAGTTGSWFGGEGKTAAQMRQAATFVGWDFTNVWGIVEGSSTPYLQLFPPPFTLNVVTQGAGRIEIAPLKATYAPGERVRLTAYSDAPGYVFKGWSGGESNALTTVTTITMSGHRTLLAVFVPATDISTVEQLQGVGGASNYRLAQDIDATATTNWNGGAGFTPLGNWYVPFTGVFDGNGHVVRGLTICRPGCSEIGLFGKVSNGGVIRKVGVVGGAVTGGTAGGLANGIYDSAVEQCYTTCDVTGTSSDVGGLIGHNEKGTIVYCYATGSVTRGGGNDFSVQKIGGLVGSTLCGVIEHCYALGNVTGFEIVGGLIGDNGFGSTVRHCYATGDVSAFYGVGGLIGRNYYGLIRQCFATGDVAGHDGVGGLIGLGWNDRIDGNETVLGECYAMGLVKSQLYGDQGLVCFPGSSGFNPSAYWDVETSLQRDRTGYFGRSSTQMKQQVTFVGWNFDKIWGIEEGVSYPYLRSDGPAFRLNVSVVGPGQVTVNPQKDYYVPGEKVTLTARPDVGTNMFLSWMGSVADRDAHVTTVTMDIHKTVTAVFAKAIEISSVEELQKIGKDVNYPPTSNYRLTQDIDATCTTNWDNGAGFMPISLTEAFSGVFEGNGHAIYGLCVNRPQQDYVGLFGRLDFEKELRHIDSVGVVGGIVRRVGLVGGSLTGRNFVGLVGANEDRGRINGCYVESSVTGSGKVGCLAGYNVGVIEKSYVAGRVTGSGTVGGLVGETGYYGRIKQCYAAGVVSGGATVGGLIGDNYDGRGVITNSYWDVEVSGCTTSAGGEGKTTAQMKRQATYAGWNFSTEWGIDEGEGYPFLWQFRLTLPPGLGTSGDTNRLGYAAWAAGHTNAWETSDFTGLPVEDFQTAWLVDRRPVAGLAGETDFEVAAFDVGESEIRVELVLTSSGVAKQGSVNGWLTIQGKAALGDAWVTVAGQQSADARVAFEGGRATLTFARPEGYRFFRPSINTAPVPVGIGLQQVAP